MTLVVIPKLVRKITDYQETCGCLPTMVKVSQGDYDAAYDEIVAWFDLFDEKVDYVPAMGRPNFLLCGVPVVVEHS